MNELTYEKLEQVAKLNTFDIFRSISYAYFILSDPIYDDSRVDKFPDNPYGWQKGLQRMKDWCVADWKDIPEKGK